MQKEHWFEKEWFLWLLFGLGILGLLKFSFFQHELYKGFFKESNYNQLTFVLIVNFFFGTIVLGSLINLYINLTKAITKKWGRDEDEKFLLFACLSFIVMYIIRFSFQFNAISNYVYQDMQTIRAEIALDLLCILLVVLPILLIGFPIFVLINLAILFINTFKKADTNNNVNKKEIVEEVIYNNSLEREFSEFVLLKEKMMLLHTYESGISEKEIDKILHNFEELYARYKTLPSPQKKVAYEQIVKAITYQDREIQKRMNIIHDKQLQSIERKVNRMMNNA